MRLFLLVVCAVAIACAPLFAIEWTSVGPGGGGAMYAPVISPHDSNLMFIACDMSGLYRSTDGGASWTMLDYRQIHYSQMFAPVFHPTDPNIIWDDDSRDWGYYIRRSTDGGITWSQVWSMPDEPCDDREYPCEDIHCLSDEPLCVLVCSWNFGLYRSTDGINFDIVPGAYEPLEIAENDSGVWIAEWDALYRSTDRGLTLSGVSVPVEVDADGLRDMAAFGNAVFILQDTLLWRSTDNGVTWAAIQNSMDYGEWAEFMLMEAAGGFIWLPIYETYPETPTMMLSTDGGDSFAPVFFCDGSWGTSPNIGYDWNTLEFDCDWGEMALGVGISRTNPNIVIWTDFGRAFITADAGTSWTPIYTEFAGTGIPDAGSPWRSVGLEVTSSWDMFISPWETGFIRIAYTDICWAFSADSGSSWRVDRDDVPYDWNNTTYDFEIDMDNEILWAAFSDLHDIPGGWSFNYWDRTGTGGVGYSADYGRTWTFLESCGLPDKPVTSIAVDNTSSPSSRRLFAAVWSDGIWRSTDGGTSWTRCPSGMDVGDGTCTVLGPNTHVVEVRVHPTGTVFALKTKYLRQDATYGSFARNDAGLWRSIDSGNTWECISSNVPECLPVDYIDSLGEHSWTDAVSFTLDSDDANHIWVCSQDCNHDKEYGGLYETTDGGVNWTRLLDIYGAFRVTPSVYYPGKMFLATVGDIGNGIMYSTDYGITWQHDEDFPFMVATRVTEDPHDSNIVWANTFGGGVWKGLISSVGIHSEQSISTPSAISLDVSPNPFNSAVTISLSVIPATSSVIPGLTRNPAIEIFDINGRMVENMTVGEGLRALPSGGIAENGSTRRCSPTNIVWQPDESLGSGVYLVRAKTAACETSRRVVYLK